MKKKGRAARFKVGPRAVPSRAAREFPFRTRSPPRATCHLFISRPIFSDPWNVFLEAGRISTQIETNYATTVSRHKNRENSNRQKSSHLFFFRLSLCQEMPNKEGATVITLFSLPGFSRVSARKTGQPRLSRSNPTGTHHIKITSRWGLEHISWSLGRFDQV